MSQVKLFTLEQANALLPQLEELLGDLVALRAEMTEQSQKAEAFLNKANGNGGGNRANQFVINMQHFQALLQTIEAIGCEIKDLDMGLVDFRTRREGRIVYLCWKRGEAQIAFWHELDTGFTSRQPL